MKKLVLLLLPFVAATALFAQPAAFFGEVDVKILPETLVYVDGDFIGNQTSAVLTSNEGNVQVTGGFDNSASADGTFVLEYNSTSSYGQLIINNAQTVNATSKVRLERVAIANQDFSQIAFPFAGYTLTDFAADLGVAGIATNNLFVTTACSSGPCGPRYRSSLYFWNNTDRTFDHVTDASASLDALNYYIVNNANHSISGNAYFMEGAPYTAPTANSTSVAMPAQTPFVDLMDTNKWGETYESYIEDITSARTDADFGTNLYQMANPFTSNIDLSFIGLDETATFGDSDNNQFAAGELVAVSYANTAAGGISEEQRTSTFIVASANASNEFDAGDINALIVPPSVPFLLKMAPSFSSGSLNFSDFIKTFEYAPRNDSNGDGNFGRNESGVAQVGINMFNANDEQEGRFYVGASTGSQSAQATRMEADAKETLFNANGIYTIQEALDGTINPNEESLPKYINLVNTDFREAIPVGVNVTEGSNFTLKLHLRSEDGQVLEADEQFSNGLNFYFHDKLDNTVVEITPDFEYSFTANESVIDRFQIFYGQEPSFLNTIDNNRVNQTLVYSLDRTSNNYAVKFSTEQLGSTADVFVYNAIGQVIYAEKNVDTSNDLNLNLVANSASFYVVKIIGENGTIVTKKILKS